MKKYIKVIILVVTVLICLFNYSYALTPSDLPGSGGQVSEIRKAGNAILSVISLIGSGISIVAIIALGIKYMMGSVEERAEYKKTLLPYFIGAVFVFASTNVAGIIYKMFN